MPHNRYLSLYCNPTGAGDSRPTALDIVRDENAEGKLKGKTVLITGCSSGIGIETARAMGATGATLFLTARNLDKAKEALAGKLESNSYELIQMDQTSLDSVRSAAKDFLARANNRLNILICNAGIMACPQAKTDDGFESQFGVNHLSHFLLFNLLQPALLASSTPSFNSRVVMVSSSGHKHSEVQHDDYQWERADTYSPFKAYGQSKTANIYMANEIDRRYGARGLHALSLHPGGIKTGLQVHMDQKQVESWDFNPEIQKWMKSVEQGAATTVYAAISNDWEGKGGKFLEDCDESPLFESGDPRSGIGYKAYVYDEAKASRLWEDSLVMVGLASSRV